METSICLGLPPSSSVNDHVLLSQFGDLLRQDHEGNANLLRHIDAIDRRQLWAKLGYPSLFAFLVTRHHMSESTAGKRIGAARTARRFPVLFAMVARGELHLSGIHRLKAHLTRENHEQVLAAAKHKTIRQIEELVARLAPQPDVPSTLRALPTRTTAAPASPTPTPAPALPAPTPATASPAPTAAPTAPSASPPMPVPRRSPDPAPLSPGRYRLQVTLGENARNKLKQLQDLLAHQIPNGDPAAIVERALDALLTQVHKRKTGITDNPRTRKIGSKSTATGAARRTRNEPRARKVQSKSTATATARRTRYIEVAVRREVWTRDEGRCGFVGEDGHRFNETRGLEVAHRHPWAKDGANTAINLGLRCIGHNAWEADRDFGTSHMANKRKSRLLNLREPIARYIVRRTPHALCCRSHGTATHYV